MDVSELINDLSIHYIVVKVAISSENCFKMGRKLSIFYDKVLPFLIGTPWVFLKILSILWKVLGISNNFVNSRYIDIRNKDVMRLSIRRAGRI